MEIFGIHIPWTKHTADKLTIRNVPQSAVPISKIPTVKPKVLNYTQQYARGRGVFTGGEYDLSEVGVCQDTDAYVFQSFKKKAGLMFKEGIDLKGVNKNTIKYIKTRMSQIARASDIPTLSLKRRIGESLIRVSNAFLVKVRDEKASGGRIRTTPNGKTLKPIAGYFPAAPETMRVDIDENTGLLRKWRQIMPNGAFKEYQPEDVIHFHIDRREGFLFGTPSLVPVFDDVRALRQIEENIELLLHQHIFPLFHYKVGTENAPAGYTEDGYKEIEVVEDQIRMMPTEGAIVTPERHEITAVGAEGRALRAEGYLTHFKKRVFSGLGVSDVDLGEGQAMTRATAHVMSRALVDSVKSIQDEFETQWNQHVISELLLESTFGDDVLEEENMVYLEFREIDIANKMDMERHHTEIWKENGLTYSEYRASLGREPIILPDDAEDQDMSKYPEWSETYWKLIREPENLIRAVDEPASPAAQAAAAARSVSLTQKAIISSNEEQRKAAQTQAEEDRKTKVAIAQTKSKRVTDNYLYEEYLNLESELSVRLKSSLQARGRFDRDYLLSFARTWGNDITSHLASMAMSEFFRGFNDQTGDMSNQAELIVSRARSALYDRIDYRVTKLIQDTIRLLDRRVDEKLKDVTLVDVELAELLNELHIAFGSLRYRADFIWDAETRKAYAFGRILGLEFTSGSGLGFQLHAHPDGCEKCRAMDGKIIPIDGVTLEDVPPYHPNSRMSFSLVIK